MATTFLRILKYGFQSFWRNAWLSAATVLIMVLALMTLEGLILFDAMTTSAVTTIQNKIDIAVYFVRGAGEDDILALKRSLEKLPEVKNVEYVSSAQALDKFKQTHTEDEIINQALTELNQNPLLASLNVRAHDPTQYSAIAAYLEKNSPSGLVDKVTYSQYKTAIDELNRFVDTLNRFGLVTTIFLAFAASLIVFNTIRLAIYSNREEIGIMRLVGGSAMFIKGPYLVTGALYGFFGAFATMLLLAPIVHGASPYVSRLIPEVKFELYFYAQAPSQFLYLLMFGVLLGVISSWIATRRYVRV